MDSFSLRVPAEPASLVLLRTELESWLAREGVRGQRAFDTVAVASEATSNAIEHAQDPTEPFVDVGAARTGDVLVVTVRDHGRWREPRFDTDRNHGLLMIDSLANRVDIDRRESGTTVTMELALDGERAES